ncbi:hypothetical protein [Alienimonas californiensis]|uniref:Uncharacterized protein n=1 Tax=Alienimonas californiensis TaxID=2527989 RepID=A0A517PFS3_9PLAN|nr:hypothetical protein [Alienimonas californiensis]QDT18211.1 hypothetical protein CA12_43520 [Alienimonas californiensis]
MIGGERVAVVEDGTGVGAGSGEDRDGGGRLIVAVAAAGPLRTARAGVFAVVLNGFVLSLVVAVWTQNPNAWNGRAIVGLALMSAGGLAVAAPFLWAWAKRAFTRTLILVDDSSLVVRTRWALPWVEKKARITRDRRGPTDHATARRRGAWWWPGGAVRTVRAFAGGPGRTVAAALPPEEERRLLDLLNARLLSPTAPAVVIRATFAPEVRAVLQGGWPVRRSMSPEALRNDVRRGRLRVTEEKDEVGTRTVIRTPAYERWGDRLATGMVLIGFGVVGTLTLGCLGAAGLMGGLPLWFQLGLAAAPAALFTVVPLIYGVWAGLGRVTVTIGTPVGADPFQPPPPAEIVSRWHVGPFGVSWRAEAAEVRAVWISGNVIRPGHRQEGVGEPRKVCALTPHLAIPVTGDYLRDSTRAQTAAVVRWALLKHGSALPGLPGEEP